MSTAKRFFTMRLVLCAVLLCAGITGAQTPDRILTFDSEIKADRDRTLLVRERFEIANKSGAFDGGIHRRLSIKGVNPQRAREGSFLPLGAKIDGRDAVLHPRVDGKTFDLGVAPETGSLPRGNHLIELSYTAKHQFLVYDDFEDLNQDISGEWPVSIEKATVELILPERLPKETGISADTGTDSNFQFDCVRTDLASGVRFETTHSLPPGQRLFISARFPHPGYFVSNFKEDGFRAVLGNNPLLFPWLAFLSGLVVFTAIGFLIGPRVLRGLDATRPVLTDHSVAVAVALVATALSTVSLFVLREPYTAMPGFMLGAITSIGISGNPHGGEPFSLVLVGVASNFVFYYLVARVVRKVF